MPLEKLQKQIESEGERKASEIREEGMKQAEAIIKQAEAKASAIMQEAEAEIKRETDRMEQEEAENVELQKRGMLLEARNRAVERAMSKLRSLTVKRIRKFGYERLIGKAIDEASGLVPQESLTLSIGRGDAKLVKSFAGRIRQESVGNGVVLANRSGTVRVTATIEGLFEKNRQEIETLLIGEAFSEKRAAPIRKAKAKKHTAKKARGRKRGR